jgi:CBS-domain-containing membrane protein
LFNVSGLFRGVGQRWSFARAAAVAVGGAVAIAAVGLLGDLSGLPLLIAPFGSTCMMIFGAPDAPFARPRNVIGGHLICSLTGLLTIRLAGDSIWVIAAAIGIAMAVMGLTRTFHPPAGGDTIVVMLTNPPMWFAVVPVLAGCLVLLAVATVFFRLRPRGSHALSPKPSAEALAET